MSASTNSEVPQNREEFTRQAAADRVGLASEFWDFLKHSKKWWLLPIIIVMMVIGVFVVLGSIGAAPFIYTLF